MKKLYEVLEIKNNNEIVDLVKEMIEYDETGTLLNEGKIKQLLNENPNYNLNNLRAELNYEVCNRFVNIVDYLNSL